MHFLKRVIKVAQFPAKAAESFRMRYLYYLYMMKRTRYLKVHQARMDERVKQSSEESRWNPKSSRWDKIGNIQFQFLIQQGMKPEHSMLDIGCGTLRGGIRFIEYLAPGNYTGIDISPEAIKYARRLVDEEGLSDRNPRLLVTTNSQFKEFEGERFDFLLAYSVFFHLPPEEIEECLQNIGNVMGRESVFFYTFKPSDKLRAAGWKKRKYNFRYPFSYLHKLAEKYGLNAELLEPPSAYNYPRQKRMVKVTKMG